MHSSEKIRLPIKSPTRFVTTLMVQVVLTVPKPPASPWCRAKTCYVYFPPSDLWLPLIWGDGTSKHLFENCFLNNYSKSSAFAERHLWPSWFERSTWKHNSLGRNKIKRQTHISPFSFNLFSVFYGFQTSLSVVIQDPVPPPQCQRMGSGSTCPRRRGLSLQQPHFKYFKARFFC